MIRSRGLSHIQIAVRDLQRSVLFYKSVLGLRDKFAGGDGVAFLTTPGAHDIITLNQAGDPERAGQTGGIAHFGFHIDGLSDFEAALLRAERAGGKVLRRGVRKTDDCPQEPWAFLADPDGYIVEVYCPTPEQ